MLVQAGRALLAPHTVAFLCKLVAIWAIVAFATAGFTTGLMLNAYIYASRAWVPERSVYERPLFFEYNSTAALASVSFVKWHQTPDGFSISPERVEFLKPNDKVDIELQLTLPESQENDALFQLHCYLKSDANAVLHAVRRPVSLPHRSPIVKAMRQLVLFPFFLAGVLTESETLRYVVARSFAEHSGAPFASVDVLLTGARPHDPPPRVADGLLTVSMRMSWFQRALSLLRVSPLLHVALVLVATALMLLSSAAAMCSCVLFMQVVAEFWGQAATEASDANSGGTRSPQDVPTATVSQDTEYGRRRPREGPRSGRGPGPLSSGPTNRGLGDRPAPNDRHAWDGDALEVIEEEMGRSGRQSGRTYASLRHNSPPITRTDAQFRSQVRAAVEQGTADFHTRLEEQARLQQFAEGASNTASTATSSMSGLSRGAGTGFLSSAWGAGSGLRSRRRRGTSADANRSSGGSVREGDTGDEAGDSSGVDEIQPADAKQD